MFGKRRSLRWGLLLAVLCLLSLVPGSARANSAHNPYYKDVVLSDTQGVDSIAVYVDGPDGAFRLFKAFKSEQKKDQRVYFERPKDATRFYIEVTMTDGTVRASEPVDCTGYDQDYKYNVKTNVLKEKADLTLLYLLLYPLLLMAPLAFTVLVEFLVALLFKLKPYSHVILINVITNLVMNMLLSSRMLVVSIKGNSILWAIALLEVAVVFVEYFFYTKKYKDQPKGKLFAFSVVANALSWGLYELAQRIIYGL